MGSPPGSHIKKHINRIPFWSYWLRGMCFYHIFIISMWHYRNKFHLFMIMPITKPPFHCRERSAITSDAEGVGFPTRMITFLEPLGSKLNDESASCKSWHVHLYMAKSTPYMLNVSAETKTEYLHFMSFIHFDITGVVEILPPVRQ